MTKYLLFFIGFVVPCLTFASGDGEEASVEKERQFHEMTEVDITTFQQVNAEDISIMGIHLGSTIPQVRSVVDNRIGLVLKQDKFNNNRFYLYESPDNGEKALLAYFKWPHEDSTMNELIIYPGFAKYIKGNSKQLVTKATMNFEKGVGKNFLGYPLNKEVILDVASLGLKHTAYFYKDKRYQVIKQVKKEDVKYAFGLFSNDANPHKENDGETP